MYFKGHDRQGNTLGGVSGGGGAFQETSGGGLRYSRLLNRSRMSSSQLSVGRVSSLRRRLSRFLNFRIKIANKYQNTSFYFSFCTVTEACRTLLTVTEDVDDS